MKEAELIEKMWTYIHTLNDYIDILHDQVTSLRAEIDRMQHVDDNPFF